MGPARKGGRGEEMEIKATVKQRDRRRVLFVTIACIIGSASGALCVTTEPKKLKDFATHLLIPGMIRSGYGN